ncbi:MAG: hypothetical protein HY974_03330, partial [Candidatus Kerfeldbacteria bacterium]|nr:hypothetical protein [Candidatus Kerfeldbacteria bacterium]
MDLDKPTETFDESNEDFSIIGGFSFTDPASPDSFPRGGEVFHVSSTTPSLTVKWNTSGTNISQVKLEYWNKNDNAGAGGWRTIKNNIPNNNHGSGSSNLNSYIWDMSSPEPIPLDLAATNIKFNITSSVPDQPDTALPSPAFVICGDVRLTAPIQNALWSADGATANTIAWNVFGKVDNVRILYSRLSDFTDPANYSEIAASTSAEAGDPLSNKGAYPWTIPTDPATGDYITRVDAAQISKIKIEDIDSTFKTWVYYTSNDFIVKGNLRIIAPASATLAAGLDCAQYYTITWERDGRINAVNIKYATDGVNYTNVIESGRTFANDSDLQRSTTQQWKVPETPVTAAYKLLVEDANYKKSGTDGTYKESANFRVKGALTLTAPTATAIWRIASAPASLISWEVDHGQLDYVKLIASKSGNFLGGADEYDVITGLNPFNDEPFNESLLPAKVGRGHYDWTLPVTTPLLNTTKFKVVQDNANFTDIQSNASAAMDIRGNITVQTPSTDWKKGETTRKVTFTSYGTGIGIAYVFLYDPDDNQEYQLDGGSGVATLGDGTSQDMNVASVPDAKSNNCVIRVRDTQVKAAAKIEAESLPFKVYPVISNVAITPTVPPNLANVWIAQAINQQLTWSVNGSNQIDSVNIYYSSTGEGGLNYTTPMISNWASSGSCNTITVPATRTIQGVIAVRDADPNFENNVKQVSANFRVAGKLNLNQPTNTSKWKVGSTDKLIKWTYDGDITAVNIYIDYGLGGGYGSLASNIPATDGTAGYNPYPAQWPNGVPDQVSNNVKIKIEDANTSYSDATIAETQPFNIIGTFSNLSATAVDPEDTKVIANRAATITWTKAGSAISNVLMQYSTNAGGNWYNIVTNNEADTTTLVLNNQSYSWTPPATVISDACQIKITDPNNSSATGQSASNFTIASKVKVIQPDANQSWDAGTGYSITWQKWGTFDKVNIYYSPSDGQDGTWTAVDPSVTNKPAHTGDGLNGSYLWTIPETTVLSPNARIKVIDSEHETYGLAIISAKFTTKGALAVLWPNDTDHKVYEAGKTSEAIKWRRFGNIAGVKVFLSTDGSTYPPTPITGFENVSFVGAETEHQEFWTPPEIIGTTYRIKVQDINNPEVKAESPLFKVQGLLDIVLPDEQAPTWVIDLPQDITWKVTHGSIPNVKIIGSRSGNFSGTLPGDDQFIIASSTPADNTLAFSAANFATYGYVASGSFPWDLDEQNPTLITNSPAVKVRVMDANTLDYPTVKSDSSAPFTIKGSLEITTPANDTWRANSTTRFDGADTVIEWFSHGKISAVHIEFYDGNQWTAVTDPNGPGASCQEGNNSFSVSNWYTYNQVPDVKSLVCKLRITDKNNPSVTIPSGEFSVYPELTSVTVTPTPTDPQARPNVWLAQSENQEVKWTENSGKITSVDIYYSSTGLGGLPGTSLKLAVPSNEASGNQSCATITVPADLTGQAAIQVRDTDSNFINKVYKNSTEFKIVGYLEITSPSAATSPKLKVGDTGKKITWNYQGNMGPAKIYVDYNYSAPGNWQELVASVDSSLGESPWTPIPDQVSNKVRLKIVDLDKPTETFDESNEDFSIIGGFSFT